MRDIFGVIAAWLYALLPEWVRLPSLTFVLPHSLYWIGLVLFPLIAMLIVKRSGAKATNDRQLVSLKIAYLLWLWGGFVGLHRFYVKALKSGMVYVLLFVLLLYGNSLGTQSRNVQSEMDNEVRIADFMVQRQQKDVERGRSGAQAKLAEAKETLAVKQKAAEEANLVHDQWLAFSGGIFAAIVIFLLVDAILLPLLVRRCIEREPPVEQTAGFEVMERGSRGDARMEITNPPIRLIERISGWSGEFVAYWSVIAVFVYYYEVIARYVFNSPTNWAHESMFLVFGMQYLLSGAYAYREDAHVRVDVIYEKFSIRTRAIIDIITSFFFFVFTATLLVTGYLFTRDSIGVWEVSFTEWGIQYWPVKITIVIGAFLLLLQGLAKLMRDVTYLMRAGSA